MDDHTTSVVGFEGAILAAWRRQRCVRAGVRRRRRRALRSSRKACNRLNAVQPQNRPPKRRSASSDSLPEGTGFEPSVPRKRRPWRETPRPTIVVSRDDLCLMAPSNLSVRRPLRQQPRDLFGRAGPMVRIRFPPARMRATGTDQVARASPIARSGRPSGIGCSADGRIRRRRALVCLKAENFCHRRVLGRERVKFASARSGLHVEHPAAGAELAIRLAQITGPAQRVKLWHNQAGRGCPGLC